MFFRLELTYDEFVDKLDIKNIDQKTTRFTIPVGLFEITVFVLMFKSLHRDEFKMNIINDDIRLKSNLTTKKDEKVYLRMFLLHHIRL